MTSRRGGTAVPHLSREHIEARAEEVLRGFSPATLARPSRTPITEIVEQRVSGEGLIFDGTHDLGTTSDGRKILGVFEQQPRAIRVDVSLANDDSRFRFTLAHEFGHLVLHSDLPIESDIGLERTIRDTEAHLASGPRELQTARDWIEWQANTFAASILMPGATIRKALVLVQQEHGIFNNQGRIILEDKRYSYQDLNRQVAALAGVYFVSRTAMQNRLTGLNVLIDRR